LQSWGSKKINQWQHNEEDCKKYGISDEVLKSSQIYAQKVVGTSKEPVIAWKQKALTSESLNQNK
jgi:hypothetical protein